MTSVSRWQPVCETVRSCSVPTQSSGTDCREDEQTLLVFCCSSTVKLPDYYCTEKSLSVRRQSRCHSTLRSAPLEKKLGPSEQSPSQSDQVNNIPPDYISYL